VTLTRRDALRLAAAAAAAPLVPYPARGQAAQATQAVAAGALPAGRFLGAHELALLDEITELIIPADEHSGGARAAGVAAFVDGDLAEFDPRIPELAAARDRFRAGLASLDDLARRELGKPFLEAPAEGRNALLERLAANEQHPRSDEERFFGELKRWTARGYYTSRIGIHDELEYKGNTVLAEFVGTDVATLPRVRPPDE
jgi:gluconate 2-dehydrogenase gamma chain